MITSENGTAMIVLVNGIKNKGTLNQNPTNLTNLMIAIPRSSLEQEMMAHIGPLGKLDRLPSKKTSLQQENGRVETGPFFDYF